MSTFICSFSFLFVLETTQQNFMNFVGNIRNTSKLNVVYNFHKNLTFWQGVVVRSWLHFGRRYWCLFISIWTGSRGDY
jgi:hypothetical protein